MNIQKRKNKIRELRKRKTHIKVQSKRTSMQPRLSIQRSNKYIAVQLIDDKKQKTLLSASSRGIKEKGTKAELAKKVGEMIAEKAKKAKIKKVVLDRGKYAYHGRVKALAEGAREGGLEF